MSAKRSPAARVLEFFTTAPQGEAELVLGLVKEVVRKRKQGPPAVVVAPPLRKRTRRPKVNAKALMDPAYVSTATPSHPCEV